jgi:iron complex transport system substrate-binding protein
MNTKKIFSVVLAALMLNACSAFDSKDASYPVTVGELTLKRSPASVVSLSPALTETVYILGYGARLTGVSDYCDRPAAAADLPRCGSALDPDIEAIANLAPALVLSSAALPEADLAALDKLEIPVLGLGRADSLDGLFEHYETLLTIFSGAEQGPAKAAQLRYYGQTVVTYVSEAVSGSLGEAAPSAILLRSMSFTMATGDTLEGELLSGMGLVNQADPYTGWSYPAQMEPDLNPDVIFYHSGIDPAALAENGYYKQTGAVRDQRLYAVDMTAFERQSPYLFETLEQMARAAFPEAFTEPRPSVVLPELLEPPPEEPKKRFFFF